MAAKLSLLLTIVLLLLALAVGNPFRVAAGGASGGADAPLGAGAAPQATPVSLQSIPNGESEENGGTEEPPSDIDPALRALLTGTFRRRGSEIAWDLRDGRVLRRGPAAGWVVEPSVGGEHEDESAEAGVRRAEVQGPGENGAGGKAEARGGG